MGQMIGYNNKKTHTHHKNKHTKKTQPTTHTQKPKPKPNKNTKTTDNSKDTQIYEYLYWVSILSHSHSHDPWSPLSYPVYAFGTSAPWLDYATVSPSVHYFFWYFITSFHKAENELIFPCKPEYLLLPQPTKTLKNPKQTKNKWNKQKSKNTLGLITLLPPLTTPSSSPLSSSIPQIPMMIFCIISKGTFPSQIWTSLVAATKPTHL